MIIMITMIIRLQDYQMKIIRYEYKVGDFSKFSKWEEGKYTRNLVHQGDH